MGQRVPFFFAFAARPSPSGVVSSPADRELKG